MKNFLREYFSYSRSETRSIIIILIILLIVFCCRIMMAKMKTESRPADEVLLNQISEAIRSFEKTEEKKYVRHTSDIKVVEKEKQQKRIPGYFDPNKADINELIHAGLKKGIAQNIIKYRNAGGRFRKPEDVRKIYGMTDSLYCILHTYIKISPDNTSVYKQETHTWKDNKEASGKWIELNTADTSVLKTIRGIGSFYALNIVKYRDQLGGFYSLEQLKEIRGMDSLRFSYIKQYACLDTLKITKINLNEAMEDRLKSHPYMNTYYARSIMYYRSAAGKIESTDELLHNKVLPATVYDKIRVYLSP